MSQSQSINQSNNQTMQLPINQSINQQLNQTMNQQQLNQQQMNHQQQINQIQQQQQQQQALSQQNALLNQSNNLVNQSTNLMNQSNNLINQSNNNQNASNLVYPQYMQQTMLHHPMALYHPSMNTPRMQQSNPQIIQSINNGSSQGWENQQWTGMNAPMSQLPIQAQHQPSTPGLSPSYALPSPSLSAISQSAPTQATAIPSPAEPTVETTKKKKERSARKVACTFCHTAKTVCVGGRPCERCIRLQKADQCVDRVTTIKRQKRDEPNGTSADNNNQFQSDLTTNSQPNKPSFNNRPVEEVTANGTTTTALDADSAWTAIPDLIHSSFFQCLLVPQRAYPAVKLEETIKNVLYVLTYLQDSLSESQFRRAITEMGYSPITNSAQGEPEPTLPVSAQSSNASDSVPEGKVLWRSTYSHLPDISMPLQFSFNWNVSPSTALHETTIASIFPTLIIERGTPVLPYIPMLHGDTVDENKEAGVPSRYRLNELDLPLSVQVNDKFEYVFAWTQSEVKLLFSRHGRRAMEKLSVGNFTPALATLRDLLDGRAEFAHTVMIRNKYGNEIAAVEHKRMVMNDTGWFERIVWTWIPLSHDR